MSKDHNTHNSTITPPEPDFAASSKLNFHWFNFRGEVRFFEEQTIRMIPYFDALLDSWSSKVYQEPQKSEPQQSESQQSEVQQRSEAPQRSEQQCELCNTNNYMIDEDYATVVRLLNYYTLYLEEPDVDIKNIELISAARRLAFFPEFIAKLKGQDNELTRLQKLQEFAKGTRTLESFGIEQTVRPKISLKDCSSSHLGPVGI